MKKIILTILLLLLTLPTFAVVDDEKYTKIGYDEVIKKAVSNSHDLKIADFQVLISKTGITGARSEYFPKLALTAGSEYTRNLRDNQNSTIASVGDSFINPYTRYQTVMGITLSYNLFDFGVRKGQLDAAKEETKIQKAKELAQLQDLKLTLLDRYSQILALQKQKNLQEEILKIQEKSLENAQRLLRAKEISKNELSDIKIQYEKTKQDLEEIKKLTNENFMWLGFYTGEQYNPENTELKDLSDSKISPEEYYDCTKTIQWKIYESEIKKKEFELKSVKRQNLPKLSLYGRYYIYGSDYSSYPDSLSDIRPSNYTLGGSLSMPVFDGLNNYANIQKVSLELQEKYVERDKAVAEWMTRVGTLKNNYIYTQNEIEATKNILSELSEKEKNTEKLMSKKLIYSQELDNIKIEHLKSQIEHEKNVVLHSSIGKGLEILTEQYGN